MEFEEKKEYWLHTTNDLSEMLLKKKYRNTNLQSHMARHYYTRHWIIQIRVKNLKRKLRKTLIKLRKTNNLDLLVNASLIS